MSDIVITVEQLSKSYWIKHQLQAGRAKTAQYDRFSEVLANAITAPFRRRKTDEAAGRQEEFWALKDVSFEVKRGEVLGVIGRNGAGKSTLLKILSRITEPSSGRIEIDGRVASLLEVGTGFHPELTGRENVFLNGAILGMSRVEIKKKFDEIVAFAEVEKFLDTPVKRYSSGMYVRLAFAVAAHLEPEILIVDEVLAVGDAQFQKKCLGKIRDVSRNDGRTVLFVSHNMAMMKTLSQSIIWLNKGEITEAGPSETVVNDYLQAGSSQADVVTNLKDRRRLSGDGVKLRITKLEWLTGLPLFHTEPVQIGIEFEAHSDVDEVTVGIGFATFEGIRLLTYETDDPGARIDVKKGHLYHATLTLDRLPVTPGLYNIDLGCRSGPMQGVDYLPACMQVEVVPGKNTQGHQARGGAGVRLPSAWEWRKQ